MDKKTYNIRVDGIEIIEKSLQKGQVEQDEIFNFEIQAQSLVHQERNLIVVITSIEIGKTKTETISVGKIMSAIGFYVDDLMNVLIKKEEGLYEIPVDLEQLLKTISISTMRGIMFSEFRGTSLHNAILPIIFADTLKQVKGSLIDQITNTPITSKLD